MSKERLNKNFLDEFMDYDFSDTIPINNPITIGKSMLIILSQT